jgi:hypothetical protein
LRTISACAATLLACTPAAAQTAGSDGAALLAEINRMRADPQFYADELRDYRELYDGLIVRFPDSDIGLITREGVRAVDEAIRYLDRQRPLLPLQPSALLARAAGDHVRDQGQRGATGHIGGDGSNPGMRVQRRGGQIYVGESITYGPDNAVDAVRQLVIDDNVPNRGHRAMLFETRWRHAGAACGRHRSYRWSCVIDFGETASGDVMPPAPPSPPKSRQGSRR